MLPNPLGNKNKGDSKLLHFIHVSMKHEDFLLHITTHQHHQSSESTQQLFDANDDNSVLTPNNNLKEVVQGVKGSFDSGTGRYWIGLLNKLTIFTI